MIKLSLNTPEVSKLGAPAPFANTLAAAVEAAAGAPPVQAAVAPTPAKKQPKPQSVQLPSNGLLTRGVRWMQNKGRSKKRMQMIETVSLGEKRFVALVKVDGREFLLGGAPSSVSMLSDLGEHGLGELLNLPEVAASVVAEAQPAALLAPAQQLPAPAVAAPQPEPMRLPEVAVEPLTLSLPVMQPEPIASPLVVEPARVNVVVEADEDESDWLLRDDLDEVFKSNVVTEPIAVAKETAKVFEFRAEPVLQKVVASTTQSAPAIAPAPQIAAPVSSTAFANANFTFQMWPAAHAPVATTMPKATAPEVAAPKAKTSIDLESCPELLGEPYLLALVQKSRGAAA